MCCWCVVGSVVDDVGVGIVMYMVCMLVYMFDVGRLFPIVGFVCQDRWYLWCTKVLFRYVCSRTIMFYFVVNIPIGIANMSSQVSLVDVVR